LGLDSIPPLESLLRFFYEKLDCPITLLGVSPISRLIVRASLIAAKECKSPIVFIASLNQVDYDGGYTGWTPKTFKNYLKGEVKRLGVSEPAFIGLDHAGPWLKDLHLQKGYSFEEAIESVEKSIESAILAGYNLIHVDATVDPYIGKPSAELVAERTLKLIEFAETVRVNNGLPPVNYEIGSDRWVYKDLEHTRKLVYLVLKGLKERKLKEARILFIVGDVGTKVKPGNRLDVDKARALVKLASKYKLFLKTHSTDYIENPEVFPKIGIGGANIGPMFADLKYRIIRKLAVEEEKLVEKGVIDEKSNILELLHEHILADGRWRKYAESLEKLSPSERELVLGLCTRYVWSKVDRELEKLFDNLAKAGIKGEEKILNEIKDYIKSILKAFNLCNVSEKMKF